MELSQINKTSRLSLKQKHATLKLWNSEYPNELEHASLLVFEHYLNQLEEPNHYIVANENGEVMAWAFVFDRDAERCFGITLHRDLQGMGIGTKLMDQLKMDEFELNGWVLDHDKSVKSDGSPYVSPIPFYKKLGFIILHEVRLELPHISAVKIQWKKIGRNNN